MRLLTDTINNITGRDESFRAAATSRLDGLTMPHWALGRLMDLAVDLCGMTRTMRPRVERKMVVVFASDHGVCAERVSLYPQEVTAQMVHNFVNGGAGINALARRAGADIRVVDMGVAESLESLATEGKILSRKIRPGTSNIAVGPAMKLDEAALAVEAGIEIANALSESIDIFGTGDMGIGNTTASAAIVSVVTGLAPREVTGTGTGIDQAQLQHKISVIERAVAINAPEPADGLDLLAKVGGFEIGAIAGLILGAARLRRPVIVDGFISTAGALIAATLSPSCRDFIIAAHKSAERGHAAALRRLGLEPLLDLNMRLGEGTGAALAMNLVEAAVGVLTEVATFTEAGVSRADER
ncbi:MAG: nicotinate-nucleotide--dimethylbenzimidazole phosphoribosyltransferase [Deltaproteobacteria bacterium]|nr:nicotinate-nucleotide--dimethylbenzimidazole phosphoribosyltransferase [Deltaproteobacteria bacterium]